MPFDDAIDKMIHLPDSVSDESGAAALLQGFPSMKAT
jgi:hypothetical protein